MLNISYTVKFKKEFKKLKSNLSFDDLHEFFIVISKLQTKTPLDRKYNDHQLAGDYSDCRDCHIKPDLLLIYNIDDKENELTLMRFNTHSELFD